MNTPPTIRIGLLADAQYADKPAVGTRFYRQSLGKLGEAVAWMNRLHPAFVVHLGDLIDEDWKNFDAPLKTLAGLSMPCRHVAGNHDFAVDEARKAEVPARLGCAERWRVVKNPLWWFVFLDTNVLSSFAWPALSAEAKRGDAAVAALLAAGGSQAKPWNGGLGTEQCGWLDRTLAEASSAGARVIIFAHQPVEPVGTHGLLDAAEVRKILARHAATVVAWINGHNHDGGYARWNGIHCLTLHGMVETEFANAHAMLDIFVDHLEILGAGREPSRNLALAR